MSKLKQLIDELCPNGVEFKELGEIINYKQPTKYIVKSTEYDNKFTTPVLTAGQSFILGYTNETDGIFNANKENPTIIFDDFTTSFHWVDFNFKVKSSAMKMLIPKSKNISFRYVYYAMCCIGYEAVDHSRHWISKYSKFEIPIPPLAVQEEIVRILDNFSELTAELQAELQGLKEQYSFFKNFLLAFENNANKKYFEKAMTRKAESSSHSGNSIAPLSDERNSNIQWKRLGDIGTFIRGNGLQKKDFTESGIGCIHYGQIYTHYGTFATETKSFVSPELAQSLKKAQKGDLIITTTSENVEDVCKAVAWLGNNDIVIGGHSTIFRHSQNPKYLSYLFQTHLFFNLKKKVAVGAKVIDVSPNKMADFIIPLPSLEEQERIVSILDKYDALVNDIKHGKGIPAEIEARKQQLDYYRNKLLTFNKLTGGGNLEH